MIKRELAKDPKLANESWDRFLPKFRRRHLKTSEKTARKNEAHATKAGARAAAGLDGTDDNTGAEGAGDSVDNATKEKEKEKPQKKVYTPFPPPQQPRKIDMQLESGEYFLKPRERVQKEMQRRKEKVRVLLAASVKLLVSDSILL